MLALILKKYTSTNVGRALLYVDIVISAAAFFAFGIKSGLFSVFGLFCMTFLIDSVLDMLSGCKYFVIVTDKPEEISACAPFLREQIRSIWPDVIVCLGNFAAHFVLRTDMGITSLRGRFHQTGHFAVLPTFHPAATLYHREWQPVLEDDFRLLGSWLQEHPVDGGGASV